MDLQQEVIRAANQRADALARADADMLRQLLHEEFRWTSHVGATYDRQEYIRRNTEDTVWRSQELCDPKVVVVGDTAVLYAQVTDVVRSDGVGHGTFTMPMTQVWVYQDGTWRCLAGHAGPRRS